VTTNQVEPDLRIAALIDVYGAPDACPIELLCTRHPADAIAFTLVEPDLSSRDLTYGELDAASARFAAGLAAHGISAGDRVATLMGKSAELVIALLGIWRLGAVHVPLFTAFAPQAIALRTTGNGTTAIVVESDQRPKLEDLAGHPMIITTGPAGPGDLSFHDLLAADAPDVTPAVVGGDGTLVEIFTSGTTGAPKGVPVPVRALAGMHAYLAYGLDVTAADVYWNAADPGWAYGLYYAIIAPLAAGRRSLLLHAGFTPERTWAVLSTFGVTNLAAAPTVYRALRNADVAVPPDLALRHCSSAGEPLTPEVIDWAEAKLGIPVRDHYGQTETGMTVANAWHPEVIGPIKPGSMGRALPGFRVEVLSRDSDEVAPAGEPGRVAIDVRDSPLMPFTGYRNAPERSAERFASDGRWYLTGDIAAKDADGFITFGSRDDDVILMAGYRIGPYEVESVLVGHPAIADAAVIGVPDELRGEVVVAYVVTHPGHEAGTALVDELQQLVKTQLAAHLYPRQVHVVDELPRTPSGKIQRFLLRERAARAAT
jgi:acetyl-CoA synthetase